MSDVSFYSQIKRYHKKELNKTIIIKGYLETKGIGWSHLKKYKIRIN